MTVEMLASLAHAGMVFAWNKRRSDPDDVTYLGKIYIRVGLERPSILEAWLYAPDWMTMLLEKEDDAVQGPGSAT
jgi:hypothetical protein